MENVEKFIVLLTLVASLPGVATGCASTDFENSDSYYHLSRKAENRNDIEDAIRLAEKSVAACPGHGNWYLLGRLRQELGRFDAALSAYGKAVSMAPDNDKKAFSLAHYGESAFMLGQNPEAVYALHRAIYVASDPPAWMKTMASQFEHRLATEQVRRGFEPITTSGKSASEQQRLFAEKIIHIVQILGGDIQQAFNILARRNYERYGQHNYEHYDSYLTEILTLKKKIEGGTTIFESMNLLETVDVLTRSFQKSGERLTDTIDRISAINRSMKSIGFANNSLEASLVNQAIVESTGGVEALNTIIGNYRRQLFTTITHSNDTMTLFRERVRHQFLDLNLNLDKFSTTSQFYDYLKAIQPSLKPENTVAYLQAGEALSILLEQEKQVVRLANREKDYIDYLGDLASRLNAIDKHLRAQQGESDLDLETYNQLAQLYLDISAKLSRFSHNGEFMP